MTDDADDCHICGGTGEIEALPDGDMIECPACVERELDAEIEILRAAMKRAWAAQTLEDAQKILWDALGIVPQAEKDDVR